MEKYSKWRDPGTGIHPFLPIKGRVREGGVISFLSWIFSLVFGSVLSVFRIGLISIVFAFMLLLSVVVGIIPVPILKRLLKRLVEGTCARLILLLMGFWSISTKQTYLSKQQKQAGGENLQVKSGDIIIANHTSYVDILYLSFRFSPVFTATPNSWPDLPPKGVVEPLSLHQALYDSISEQPHSEKAISVSKIIKDAQNNDSGPVVIFPEGATSNGLTLLDPIPVFDSQDLVSGFDTSRVHVIGFKYENENFSPTFTVGNFFIHLFRLCSQFSNQLQVRYLASANIPPLPLDGSSPTKKKSEDLGEWGDVLVRNLASILQIRRAKLNAMDKRDFLNYWYGHQQLYSDSKKQN
eukprot:TRINITY_DN3480_c0_g1_i1.p1 TRINITY_DN3480_c0_g1~~TRINITY_DN3480_c0_g1_i1.p1  ORF type:complete len:352 (-),score=66.81 TRINITY_DN3480_c0_g1_i1:290-1345(-)